MRKRPACSRDTSPGLQIKSAGWVITNKCRKDKKLYVYKRFVCQARDNHSEKAFGFKCDNKNWRKEVLVDIVLNEIRRLSIEPDFFESLTNQIPKNDDRKILSAEIKKIDNQISRLMDLYALEEAPIDTVRDKIAALTEKKKAISANIKKLNDDKARKEHIKKLKKSVSQIPMILDNGSEEEIRQIVVELIKRIEIDGDDVSIYWNF